MNSRWRKFTHSLLFDITVVAVTVLGTCLLGLYLSVVWSPV